LVGVLYERQPKIKIARNALKTSSPRHELNFKEIEVITILLCLFWLKLVTRNKREKIIQFSSKMQEAAEFCSASECLKCGESQLLFCNCNKPMRCPKCRQETTQENLVQQLRLSDQLGQVFTWVCEQCKIGYSNGLSEWRCAQRTKYTCAKQLGENFVCLTLHNSNRGQVRARAEDSSSHKFEEKHSATAGFVEFLEQLKKKPLECPKI
jgi:hypothetical protein